MSDALNTFAAVASAVAAIAAWFATRRANSTAETVAKIERDRWHADLTPTFNITLDEQGSGHARLNVHLDGPDALQALDEVSITVGNDDLDHTIISRLGGPTQEEVDAHVWGPWRFTPSADRADQHGRGVPSVPLTVGRGRPFSMERTRPGWWMEGMTDEQWQRRYVGHPIRLVLTCRRGTEEWVLTRRVDNPAFQQE